AFCNLNILDKQRKNIHLDTTFQKKKKKKKKKKKEIKKKEIKKKEKKKYTNLCSASLYKNQNIA
ncbi:MAG: hypothetical protein RR988_06240, partial [Clostridia bacterium]